MRGPLDTLAAMRTPARVCMDLIEEPDGVRAVLAELAELYIELADILLEIVPPFHGGYVTRMHMWAPDRAITPQNDVSTLVSPSMYAEFVLPWDREIIAHFPYQSFHLHASEHHIVDLLLTIDELTAIQVTLEHTLGGPPLERMLPLANRILSAKPLILVVYDFDTAEECLRELPAAGLCLMVAPDTITTAFGREYDDWLEAHCIAGLE
jgi:hypothetical protein